MLGSKQKQTTHKIKQKVCEIKQRFGLDTKKLCAFFWVFKLAA